VTFDNHETTAPVTFKSAQTTTVVAFVQQASGGDDIERLDPGSWLTDGYKVGDTITVNGTVHNNGTYTIAGVTATTLTLTVSQTVTAELSTAIVVDQRGTLARSDAGGSWLTDGFKVGDTIAVSGTANNNGAYEITGVTATTLTVAQHVNAETATAAVADKSQHDTITRTDAGGSWLADGLKAGDVITISGTAHNDGTFTIASVSATTLTLNVSQFVTNESESAAIADTNHGDAHVLARELTGLRDGVTYYVVDSNPANGTFGLAATQGGAAIHINNGDDVQTLDGQGHVVQTVHVVTREGINRVGTEGIDLQAGTGTQTLHIDLT
jgi:hypothetical protein